MSADVAPRHARTQTSAACPSSTTETGLLGVITEHDLIQRHAPVHQPRYITVLSAYIPISPREVREYQEQLRQTLAIDAGQLMTVEATTVAPDDDVEEALEMMLDPEVTLLPVVEGRKVLGVVTRTDLVRLIEKLGSRTGRNGRRSGIGSPQSAQRDTEKTQRGGQSKETRLP